MRKRHPRGILGRVELSPRASLQGRSFKGEENLATGTRTWNRRPLAVVARGVSWLRAAIYGVETLGAARCYRPPIRFLRRKEVAAAQGGCCGIRGGNASDPGFPAKTCSGPSAPGIGCAIGCTFRAVPGHIHRQLHPPLENLPVHALRLGHRFDAQIPCKHLPTVVELGQRLI